MKEMAQINETSSKLSLLKGDIQLENLSGWMIWEIVIAIAFFTLCALTVFSFLAKSGLLKKKRKRFFVPRKRKRGFFLGFRKGRSKSKTKAKVKHIVRKKSQKGKPVLKKGGKKYTGKIKRKSGVSNPRKMPAILDPNIIRSYTNKYLARKKVKATWEKILLAGVDSDNNRLDLTVYLLSKEFMWRSGAADVIEFNKRAVNPVKLFKNKGIKQTFQKTVGLVSVGVVTEMTDVEEKEGLARARAEKMITWLKKSLPRKKADYLLTLESPLVESGEAVEAVVQPEKPRPVLWICLHSISGEVDVEDALKDALSRAIQLPFDFDSYQKVSLINISS